MISHRVLANPCAGAHPRGRGLGAHIAAASSPIRASDPAKRM